MTPLERVAAATVHIPELNANGVLVHGGFVLTVAQSLPTLDDFRACTVDLIEIAIRSNDLRISASPVAFECITGIVALQQQTASNLKTNEVSFQEFCQTHEPVSLFDGGYSDDGDLPAHVQANGVWLGGTVNVYGADCPMAAFHASGDAGELMPGSPIVSEDGRLVALVAMRELTAAIEASELIAGLHRIHPRPQRALPGWILTSIRDGEWRYRAPKS